MPDSVRVIIRKDQDTGKLRIESNHTLPTVDEAAVFLTGTHEQIYKRFTRRWGSPRNWERFVESEQLKAIPLQIIADSIRSAIISKKTELIGVRSESRDLVQCTYQVQGDNIYKLVPVGVAGASRALRAARQKAMEQAQLEAQTITEDAQKAADVLIKAAAKEREQAVKVREKAEKEIGAIPPVDLRMTGRPLMYNRLSQKWSVGLNLGIRFREFVYEYVALGQQRRHVWPAKNPDGKHRIVRAWVPVNNDGTYAVTSVHVDRLETALPHINQASACMAPADIPHRLRSENDVLELEDAITFCMRRVDLHSLYSSPTYWAEPYKEMIPDVLYPLLILDNRDAIGALARQGSEVLQPNSEAEWTTTS